MECLLNEKGFWFEAETFFIENSDMMTCLQWHIVTGPLKKYGSVQPAPDLSAPYTDVSGQNPQQFTPR